MSLKITKSTDVITVEQCVVCLYSLPGHGKSTCGFTAFKTLPDGKVLPPLLLDFDGGAYRAVNRGDTVQVKNWKDVEAVQREDFEGYGMVVVDTAGRALDALALDIIAEDPKLGRSGQLTLQGFGVLKGRFGAWLRLVKSFGLDVVLIAHSDEQRKGDELIERIDAQGASKNEIYKSADLMGRIALEGGKRVLKFSPTDTTFGKNPVSFGVIEVPAVKPGERSTFLGDLIAEAKARLNALTQEQVEVRQGLAEWQQAIDGALERPSTAPAALTALVGKLEGMDPRLKMNARRILNDAAKGHGFTYDKAAGAFVAQAEEKAGAKAAEPASEPQAATEPGTITPELEASIEQVKQKRQKANASLFAAPAGGMAPVGKGGRE